MNISIDASTASPSALRLTAAILTFIAGFKENPVTANTSLPQMNLSATPPEAPVAPILPATPIVDNKPDELARLGVVPSHGILDVAGTQWDPEVHTANQSKTTEGTWRRKRTNKGEVAAVSKVIDIPQVPPPPPAPSVESAPATIPAPPVSSILVDASSPLMALGGNTFAAIVKYATNLVGAKKISTAQLLEACTECGVPDIHACSKPENAALIPQVALAIQAKVPQ